MTNRINVRDSKDEVTRVIKAERDLGNSLLMSGEGEFVNSEERGTVLMGQTSKEFSNRPSIQMIAS